MSDVELLCEQNHQRVRWAYEYADYGIREPERTEAEERRYAAKVRRRRHCIRAAATLCTVIHSLGLMVIGMGLADASLSIIGVGAAVAGVFLLSRHALDAMAEGGENDA